ncbi:MULTISPECIES: DUF1090 domain-containing protein [Stutzerimonas]|uniref:DUF1090 domain-containing protein n=2 Tax=Stutzerimonas TaxID=2901164 RepID=I4CNC9_STUST|nr:MULTISPECIES: DUF1090 domain-containing protein [Stutzerimonas]HBC01057.1 DUF1090 domain-containing protein [Pseudomonas sp.]AFM31586.1 hypothetical protein A458_01640 [Stutzerimonas stutzeri CCUG 29243]MCQ2038573.1 DUF1090 domain-containing protein [Stutzerimonas kunmingensis]MCQ2041883.1 DUF1090 domain-containing protein [Stutzerimonas kunmingensis]RRV14317.1 DUF1090 domain-containing protein [Stutzerimonas xanthomarina]
MSLRHWPIALLIGATAISPLASAAPNADSQCHDQRQALREQLQQARLLGDKLRQTQLDSELQGLTEQCQGVVALHPHQVEYDHTNRQVERRETLLREALGTGDAQLIELRRNQLAKSREKLESLRR